MNNSKEMPGWFNSPKMVSVKSDIKPLDFLALAEDISYNPLTVETEHYIHALLRRIEDEHAFRCKPLTQDELNARIILKGYLQQIEDARPVTCSDCSGTGFHCHKLRLIHTLSCRHCDGRRTVKP